MISRKNRQSCNEDFEGFIRRFFARSTYNNFQALFFGVADRQYGEIFGGRRFLIGFRIGLQGLEFYRSPRKVY
ncbi:MAG TPA: hypothetical protein DEA22_01215 [Blastocatellia bacterium]|nr:hypothetical protein [Blastocatellia bacterium]